MVELFFWGLSTKQNCNNNKQNICYGIFLRPDSVAGWLNNKILVCADTKSGETAIAE